MMVPKTYFEQVMPENSVDIGLSMTTLHWLGTDHANIGFQFLPPEADALVAAHHDLVRFLKHRSQEIRSGGTLILAIIGKGEVCPVDNLTSFSLAIDDLEREGEIPSSVAAVCRFPVYLRSLDEILGAVDAEKSWDIFERYQKVIEDPAETWYRSMTAVPDQTMSSSSIQQDYIDRIWNTTWSAVGRGVLDAIKIECDQPEVVKEKEVMVMEHLKERFRYHFRQAGHRSTIGGHYHFLRLRNSK